MKIRGKFVVSKHTHHQADKAQVEIELNAQYSNKNPEDNTYSKATPSGHIAMTVTVPEVVDALPIGKAFYVDFSPFE